MSLIFALLNLTVVQGRLDLGKHKAESGRKQHLPTSAFRHFGNFDTFGHFRLKIESPQFIFNDNDTVLIRTAFAVQQMMLQK